MGTGFAVEAKHLAPRLGRASIAKEVPRQLPALRPRTTPLGPLGFDFSQHRRTPSVERIRVVRVIALS